MKPAVQDQETNPKKTTKTVVLTRDQPKDRTTREDRTMRTKREDLASETVDP